MTQNEIMSFLEQVLADPALVTAEAIRDAITDRWIDDKSDTYRAGQASILDILV